MLKEFREKRSLRLVTALVVGFLFGFLLDKGGATEYDVLVNQLLLRDFTVLKIIFSAIIVGSVGFHLLANRGLVDSRVKPFKPKSQIIGGLVFGVGFALLGYCPGTLVGAIGGGSIHALFGAVGMVAGSGAFAHLYPRINRFIEGDNRGDITIPQLIKAETTPVIILTGLLLGLTMVLLEILGL